METNLVISSQCQSNMDHKTGQYRLMDLIKMREKMKSFSNRGKREKIFHRALKLANKIFKSKKLFTFSRHTILFIHKHFGYHNNLIHSLNYVIFISAFWNLNGLFKNCSCFGSTMKTLKFIKEWRLCLFITTFGKWKFCTCSPKGKWYI